MSHLDDGALPSTRDGVHETADLPMPPPVPAGLPADLAALDRFSAKPQDLPAWEAARDAMGSADNDDPLPAARDALMMAVDVPARERARQELAGLLDELRPLPMPAHFRPASDIADPLPRPVLRAAGQGGALLSEGAVVMLAGAGGAAKSTLASTLALDVAYGGDLVDPSGPDGLATGFSGLFDVRPGAVMIASYEDPAGVVSWRLRELAHARRAADAVLSRVHVAHFAGLPLYGPRSLYNARPEPLRGWRHLWDAVDRIRPTLLIVDPALAAYVGEPNHLSAVREFVAGLSTEAATRRCGVLLIAHSRKAARGAKEDPFDPGQVGGASAWPDAARGVLTLTGKGDDRTLAIAKANWGRAFILAALKPVVTASGALIGFDKGPDPWSVEKPKETPYDSKT